MSKTRYKIRKEQLERVVESFVTETAAPEAKKHTQGYNDKEDESLGMRNGKESTKKQSKKARRDDSLGKWGKRTKQAPEAKKHVKSKMTESEKLNEVDPLTVGLGVAGLISLAGGAAAIEGYCDKLTDKQKAGKFGAFCRHMKAIGSSSAQAKRHVKGDYMSESKKVITEAVDPISVGLGIAALIAAVAGGVAAEEYVDKMPKEAQKDSRIAKFINTLRTASKAGKDARGHRGY
jgi:SpoU rRNA methylase family enzyme